MKVNPCGIACLSMCVWMSGSILSGATITFSTPAGASVGSGIVSASALFTTSAGLLTITVKDLLANPTSAGQLVSDVDFMISSALSGTTTYSSSAQLVTVHGDGSITLGSTVSTGWGFGTNGVGYTICVICSPSYTMSTKATATPSEEILGPGPYTNANGSIAGNKPHNPFLYESATFTIMNASITANTKVTSAIFSFGTTPCVDVSGVVETPEAGSGWLLAGGLLGALVLRKRT